MLVTGFPADVVQDAADAPFDMSRAAVFNPIKAYTAFEETVERILTAVRLGVLPLGSRLPAERDLAEQLHVSRVTLREALRALQNSGYLETRRGRYGGTFVVADIADAMPPEKQSVESAARDMEDILIMREALEISAAELAAGRDLAAAERGYLVSALEDCENAHDLQHYRRADSRFHLVIAELTQSHRLVASLSETRVQLNLLLDRIPALPQNVSNAHEQHRAIVDAILAGRPDVARASMRVHVHGTAALLRGFITA